MQLRMRVQPIHSATRLSVRKNLHRAASSRFPVSGRGAFGLLLLLLVSAFGAQSLSAQTYQDLYDFGAGGCCPSPSLMAQGRDGNIYGTTSTGGTANKGIVFKITPAGALTTLYNFDGTHGATPVGGLLLGNDGNLYGTAEFGGANSYGTIFKITPAGVLTVLYNFTGSASGHTDGGYPVSPLIIGSDGNFYGTSYPGYAYKMSPAGVFQSITKIPGITLGPLLQARNGSFYGTTEFQGTHGGGTIYRITAGTATTIHNFDQASGSFPVGGLVEGSDGNLYGTTTAGGSTNAGVIYRITPAGVYTTLISFDNVHTLNGYEADAGLIAGADGNLYGATVWGGQYGYGVIFEMTTSGAYSVLYNFDAPHGDGAYATPIQHTNGRIYGTTTRGGAGGKGVVYGFSAGLAPFIQLTSSTGIVGKTVGILGRGFSDASSVEFNGTPTSFHVISNTFMTATVPSGETGFVQIDTTSGNLVSSKAFRVTPQLTSFTPATGKVGDSVQITGAGLIQTISITVGGVPVTAFTVNSDSTVTFAVPAGAKTGTIALTTPGGKVVSKGTFTVTK
jgi:uncharacterized repeat protein (TIGR03803 family)